MLSNTFTAALRVAVGDAVEALTLAASAPAVPPAARADLKAILTASRGARDQLAAFDDCAARGEPRPDSHLGGCARRLEEVVVRLLALSTTAGGRRVARALQFYAGAFSAAADELVAADTSGPVRPLMSPPPPRLRSRDAARGGNVIDFAAHRADREPHR